MNYEGGIIRAELLGAWEKIYRDKTPGVLSFRYSIIAQLQLFTQCVLEILPLVTSDCLLASSMLEQQIRGTRRETAEI